MVLRIERSESLGHTCHSGWKSLLHFTLILTLIATVAVVQTSQDVKTSSDKNEVQQPSEIEIPKEDKDTTQSAGTKNAELGSPVLSETSLNAEVASEKPSINENVTSTSTERVTSTNAGVAEMTEKKNATTDTAIYGKENVTTTAPSGEESVTTLKNEEEVPVCEERKGSYWWMILQIIICAYSFLGIAIICHYYFLPSLGRICEKLKMSEDVVGATFMAAGSSAPELAVVVIAVFFTQDDIGISDVIGSAVFNLMFVIALCGFLVTSPVQLNWWPMCRNCFFYTVSILVLVVTIFNGKVSWFESLLLLLVYTSYCVALYYNKLLEAWVHTLPLPFNKLLGDVQVKTDIVQEEGTNIAMNDQKVHSYSTNVTNHHNVQQSFDSVNDAYDMQVPKAVSSEEKAFPTLPPDATLTQRIQLYIVLPIHYVCSITIPNCRSKKWQAFYPVTFFMSIVWISFYSYELIWMIRHIGNTLGIPDTIMGFTLLAAGVSVPDAITSINVVKKGYGDMGVSNAVGSNIFDILVGLGLPWFLQTALFSPNGYVKVHSKGMLYSTLLLFSLVLLLIVTAHCNKWKLDKTFATVLLIGYAIFLTLVVTYELMHDQCV